MKPDKTGILPGRSRRDQDIYRVSPADADPVAPQRRRSRQHAKRAAVQDRSHISLIIGGIACVGQVDTGQGNAP